MKKNLIIPLLLVLSIFGNAQIVFHVDTDALFYISENTLVYNGGGVQTKGNGKYDVHGNVMVVGSGSDLLRTLDNSGSGSKTNGGNFILRLNNPGTYSSSGYGQLYINGLSQSNITAIVDKEYRNIKHGTYQQIAMPFYQKPMSELSTELNKVFNNTRWSQNEILVYNNSRAVSDYLSIYSTTPKNTAYYMLGSKNLDTGTPPVSMPANAPLADGQVYTLRGVPYAAGISETLKDGGNVNFGSGGNAINEYNERYNSYLQDSFDASAGVWTGTFGKNLYQFGNPYFTNLDLSKIGYVETGATTDGNNITTIQGIRYSPGTVQSLPSGATYSTAAQYITFDTNPLSPTFGRPVGDISGIIIKPMQTFVLKLRSAAEQTLSFDNLRRFKNNARADGTSYTVTAAKGASSTQTMKQLGIIALDADKKELARTYYVVYPEAKTGHTTDVKTQVTLGGGNIFGTFEEHPVNGGYDTNYTGSYWLYINEANEVDFFGKAIPLALYKSEIKFLKFEIRENAELIEDGVHQLSTGIGFYYKDINGGEIKEAYQNQIIPMTSYEYNLYYGKGNAGTLGDTNIAKPSRTMVVYNQHIDSFVVRFDPDWNKAEINVFDFNGRLILSKKEVKTNSDFVLDINKKINTGYIVTAVSEKGEKISSKIIR